MLWLVGVITSHLKTASKYESEINENVESALGLSQKKKEVYTSH